MLKKIRLERFKGFQEAELILGKFTVLVGINATGKSNIGDALQFLHGIGRGYNLSEILGKKWGPGGIKEWEGIRGGKQNIAFNKSASFALEVTLNIPINTKKIKKQEEVVYRIEVAPGEVQESPYIINESLQVLGAKSAIFSVKYTPDICLKIKNKKIDIFSEAIQYNSQLKLKNSPLITYFGNATNKQLDVWIGALLSEFHQQEQDIIVSTLATFQNMRFLDVRPAAMREPSNPGQDILGSQGENISSVLQIICQKSHQKKILLSWLKALTPMDASDLEFGTNESDGRIFLRLVESNGQKIPISVASDGTLRFLAILTALFKETLDTDNQILPPVVNSYFLEELENGLHPTRLHLLIELIEKRVNENNLQIIATTHSAQILELLSKETLASTSFTYRLENQPDARIKRILDVSPKIQTLIEEQGLTELYESGWLENMMEFSEAN